MRADLNAMHRLEVIVVCYGLCDLVMLETQQDTPQTSGTQIKCAFRSRISPIHFTSLRLVRSMTLRIKPNSVQGFKLRNHYLIAYSIKLCPQHLIKGGSFSLSA